MKKFLIGLAVGTYVTRVRDNYRFMKKYPDLDRSKELQASFDKLRESFSR